MKIQYLYYNNLEAIKNLERRSYPEMDVQFIFIDDGSKEPLKLDWPNAKVYRIEKDVIWNQPAANNLGFSKLDPQDVVLRLDIDHFILPAQLLWMKRMAEELKPKEIIRFRRILDGRTVINYAPNIYMARVGELIEAGGYDERFCGNYGHDDTEFLYRLRKKGFTFRLHEFLKIHVTGNLGTRGLDRDTLINKKLFEKLKQ